MANWAPDSWGPTVRGPVVRGPTIRGPIVRGPICLDPLPLHLPLLVLLFLTLLLFFLLLLLLLLLPPWQIGAVDKLEVSTSGQQQVGMRRVSGCEFTRAMPVQAPLAPKYKNKRSIVILKLQPIISLDRIRRDFHF